MRNNAFKMSLLFIFFVTFGVFVRMFLLSSVTGKTIAEQLELDQLACIFTRC